MNNSSDNGDLNKTDKDLAWDSHEQEQILFIAKNTTALQRLKWLEEMKQIFKDQMIDQTER